MAYTNTHQLITLRWKQLVTGEYAESTFRINQVAPLTQTEINAVFSAVGITWASANMQITPDYVLQYCKAATIQADGTYPPTSEPVYSVGSPVAGTSTGGTKWPLQVGLVATLMTDFPRGVGSKGRMYLPPIDFPLQATDHRWSASACQSRANAVALMVGAVNDITSGQVSVMSRVGAGVSNPVTSVRVGNRADIMRSRDNSVPEAYVSAPVT